MSRISCYLFLSFWLIHPSVGQQQSNDFTRRVGSFDGKLNRYSGKFFIDAKLNSKLNNRIKIEEWPTKYSPFGGKRFVSKNPLGLIKKRIPWQKIQGERPLTERLSKVGNEKIFETDLVNRTSATAAVEFRDAVYAQLDKRVDDWLNKVNNVSLQEINRYQFRKGRPSEPGFPVQQAGSEGNQEVPKRIKSSIPAERPASSEPSAGSSYWLGPRTTSVQKAIQAMPQAIPAKPKGGYRTVSQPILGPKKVRVEVGSPK